MLAATTRTPAVPSLGHYDQRPFELGLDFITELF